jgi:hypothetical protein
MTRKYVPWTAKQAAYVRSRWGKDTSVSIGEAVGRTATNVRAFAASLGLPPLTEWGKTNKNRGGITRMVLAGWSCPRIGRRLGMSPSAVWMALKRWGVSVPAEAKSAGRSKGARRGVRLYAFSQGCRTLGEVRRANAISEAIALGWPHAGTATRARVCEVVHAAGTATLDDILAAFRDCRGIRTSQSARQLAYEMCRDGLLVRVKRGRYAIGPEAGEPLARREAS